MEISVVGIAAIITAGVSLLGIPVAAALWVRNTVSCLRRETEEKIESAKKATDRKLAQERSTMDQIYARREELTALNAKLDGIATGIREVKGDMHELRRQLGRRPSTSDTQDIPRQGGRGRHGGGR